MQSRPSNRGFTLVEVLVSMSLGLAVMAAIFSTYLYLGRNLTQLSYKSLLEKQSRAILNTFAMDVRNAKAVANPPAVSATATTLALKMFDGSVTVYNFSGGKLTRDPDGSGTAPSAVLNNDIGDVNLQVPVTMQNFSFLYLTTSGASPISQFTSSAITPMSIKQLAITFVLQAGDPTVQGQQGTLVTFPVSSGLMPLINRSFPDGT